MTSARHKIIKCVVWDLDETLWSGVLLEDDAVTLRPGVADVIAALDERGILQSVASRNDYAVAFERLERFGLAAYFLYPQIHWNTKTSSVEAIARNLNIGLDSLAFVDDDPFERGQMQAAHPEIVCFDAADIGRLATLPELTAVATADGRNRRLHYLSEIKRKEAEEAFSGPHEAFLATLGMKLTISRAQLSDLARASELTVRTHQLNTTGLTYSQQELERFIGSKQHLLLLATLEDCYGDYGRVGLALIETDTTVWTIKLLLMSCRVASRGAGSMLIQQLRQRARREGVRLLADFVETPRNRQMYVTYRFSGFREIERQGARVVFESDQASLAALPDYVTIVDAADSVESTAS